MIPSYIEVNNAYTKNYGNEGTESKVTKLGRVRQMMSLRARRPIFEILRISLADSVSRTLQLFHLFNRSKHTPMCTNYGHVVARGNWGRGLPKCQECGVTINDAKELRKANHPQLTVPPGR